MIDSLSAFFFYSIHLTLLSKVLVPYLSNFGFIFLLRLIPLLLFPEGCLPGRVAAPNQ